MTFFAFHMFFLVGTLFFGATLGWLAGRRHDRRDLKARPED
jgi:hypothetical protein